MTKINPNSHSPSHNVQKPEKAPDYSRDLYSMGLEIPGATHEPLARITAYQNALKTPRSLQDRVSRKLPPNKRVGEVGFAAERAVLRNKACLTRLAPRLSGTAPFSPPHAKRPKT